MGKTQNTPEALAECHRIAVMMVAEDGLGPVEVAHCLRVSRQSVYDWVRRYRLREADGIAPKVRPGPQARLQLLQERRLTELLLQGARAAGYRTDLRTRRRVREIIDREFAVNYHTDHISRVLARMGWTYQKPEHQARERNPVDVAQWIKERWPRIKKKHSRGRPRSASSTRPGSRKSRPSAKRGRPPASRRS